MQLSTSQDLPRVAYISIRRQTDSMYDARSEPNGDNNVFYSTTGAFALSRGGLETCLFWRVGQFGNEVVTSEVELLTSALWISADGQVIWHQRGHFKWIVCLH